MILNSHPRAVTFAGHSNVFVRDELRERRTGLPCDERSPTYALEHRSSFENMYFSSLNSSRSTNESQAAWSGHSAVAPGCFARVGSALRHTSTSLGQLLSGRANGKEASRGLKSSSMISSERNSERGGHSAKDPCTVEGKADVRLRAHGLLVMLREHAEYRQHATIAIVTHKGWLREFEHGPLGRPHATEFDNAEVRAFRLRLGADGAMDVTRTHPAEELGARAEEEAEPAHD